MFHVFLQRPCPAALGAVLFRCFIICLASFVFSVALRWSACGWQDVKIHLLTGLYFFRLYCTMLYSDRLHHSMLRSTYTFTHLFIVSPALTFGAEK